MTVEHVLYTAGRVLVMVGGPLGSQFYLCSWEERKKERVLSDVWVFIYTERAMIVW